MAIPFLAEIERLITERGSSAILRERLALANDRFVDLERKVAQLEQENARLRAAADERQRERPRQAPAEQFEEGRGGALFKRRTEGGYVLAVYCPTDREPTAAFPPKSGQFVCNRCGWFSDFEYGDLAAVISELPD
jgi:hypothetical protein